MRFYIYIIISILSTNSFAQKEGNIWYFGYGGGIDFNSGVPVELTDGMLNAYEGGATISDEKGSLLFYTDGVKVWNKNHYIMPNGIGLMGNNSSSQSSIIIKKPGSDSLYYIFTVSGPAAGPAGVRYSVVDKSLDGGLGDVTSSKNILITTPSCEKITAVKHDNGRDFWIIIKPYNSSDFHSYLLTPSGFNAIPIISGVGIHINLSANAVGYLKASSDGKKVACVNYYLSSKVEILDFDPSTGLLSNPILINSLYHPYGVEFSSNNKLLYISEEISSNVYQYNLQANSPIAFQNSKILIGTLIGGGGALQIAPDEKIYCSSLSNNLGVINSPNSLGLTCNFAPNGFQLTSGSCSYGLPNFVNTSFVVTNSFCLGDSTEFLFAYESAYDSILWNFDDPKSGSHNFSTDSLVYHIFSDTGIYNVSLMVCNGIICDTFWKKMFINPLPLIDLGEDTAYICNNDFIVLDASLPNSTYLWQDSTTHSNLTVNQAGTYWVEVTSNGCLSRDTVVIDSKMIDIGNDTTICNEESIVLDAMDEDATSYTWNDNSTYPTLEVDREGLYSVLVYVGNCEMTDTININTKNCKVIFDMPNIFTPNDDGYNDLFMPIKTRGVKILRTSIYNRWGVHLFDTNNGNIEWDGDKVSDGTYFYRIHYIDNQENREVKKGYVNLVR